VPLLTLDRLSMAFGHLPLLDETSLQVEPRERVCVLGRNGSGRSALLRTEHRLYSIRRSTTTPKS